MLGRRPASMTRALSQDLRSRLIAVVADSLSCNAAPSVSASRLRPPFVGSAPGVSKVGSRPCHKVAICARITEAYRGPILAAIRESLIYSAVGNIGDIW